jgi:hypothetical protein
MEVGERKRYIYIYICVCVHVGEARHALLKKRPQVHWRTAGEDFPEDAEDSGPVEPSGSRKIPSPAAPP